MVYYIGEVIYMQNVISVATAPKTSTFQMRINPDVRQQIENVYAKYGLSLTDAINIFFQQSLNESGLPFLLSPENAEYMKAKAVARLMAEIQKGWDSVKKESDWVSEDDAYRMLGVEE
jgi:DNA-damage-inducible protein J